MRERFEVDLKYLKETQARLESDLEEKKAKIEQLEAQLQAWNRLQAAGSGNAGPHEDLIRASEMYRVKCESLESRVRQLEGDLERERIRQASLECACLTAAPSSASPDPLSIRCPVAHVADLKAMTLTAERTRIESDVAIRELKDKNVAIETSKEVLKARLEELEMALRSWNELKKMNVDDPGGARVVAALQAESEAQKQHIRRLEQELQDAQRRGGGGESEGAAARLRLQSQWHRR
jgi:chromosome segregation ATPase